MQAMRLTRHARQRLRQRGVRTTEIEIILAYADIEVPARNGCRFLRLSNNAAASLYEDRFAVQDIDRARRLMVLADPTDQIVTVIKLGPAERILRPRGAERGRYERR
jgi:Domain of unknown function (DUF4258)